ncbi:MAG: hypothetical protein ACT4OS_03875 [Acidimicrobiales bacterium]
MRTRLAAGSASRAVAFALVVASTLVGCGGPESDAESLAKATRLLPEALAPGATSPALGAPLPQGVEPEVSTGPDTEVFEIAPPVTLSEVNAFYQREMDNKPFGNFAWCASELDEINKTVTRFWGSTGASQYRSVVIRATTVNEPTQILVIERAGAVPVQCQTS